MNQDTNSDASTDTPLAEVSTRLRAGLTMPRGFSWCATRCGIKQGRADLGVIVSNPPAAAAACLTRNQMRAPCVARNAGLVPADAISAVLVNSGNANAMTGEVGRQTNDDIATELAAALSVPEAQVLTASTGVIGVPMPGDLVARALPSLVANLSEDPEGFSNAILTTDTRTKVAHLEFTLPGSETPVVVLGIAKGSGMIHPDMATTLGFVCTDAAVSAELLHELLAGIVDDTFNAVTVDGDTSTNDMVFALANGQSEVAISDQSGIDTLRRALASVLDSLAEQVARDGEGATRLLEVLVTGAPDRAAAKAIARGVCSSSLVKCSVFAGQPDFGRVAMAVGQTAHERGLSVDAASLSISAQGIELYNAQGPQTVRSADVVRRMREPVVRWSVDLGQGRHRFVARGCDLSYDYVRINADESTQIEVSAQGSVSRNPTLGAYSPRLKHQLLVEGLTYVRRFTALKVLVYVPPNVGGPELSRNVAQDLELCLDAGLRPVVSLPNEADADVVHAQLKAAGHFTSSVSSDPTRMTRLLDRGHLCVLVKTDPDPSGVVDLAIKIGAQKLVVLTNESGLRDNQGHVQRVSPENFMTGMSRGRFDATHADTLVVARHAVARGVPQLHILDARVPHAIVGELFTDDGIGSLITRQVVG
ncbi:MAG: bifunctional glutamate N-acetyltransferase/amino-acid acetyltransferase ArgJ [Myxococcota bacterium]